MKLPPTIVEIKHFHVFCGLGAGARGFNKGQARVGNLKAKFRCLGGIDHDPAGLRDFAHLAGVPGTLIDLFSREQYRAFHGEEPPAGWAEATPMQMRLAAGNEVPDIVFLSAPCKGFSGLLPEMMSKTLKYQALNGLTLRGMWLVLEAYKDDPVKLFVFENVPRIATRGRKLLDQIIALLHAYGYVVNETTHDCGEIGNLAQSRKRFLLVARHRDKVPAFVYEPRKYPLRGVGEVLGKIPMPGLGHGGPMHRMPSLQWKTWVRLAFVKAGSDWRSLNDLRVNEGVLADYGIVPEQPLFNNAFNVKGWGETAGTVTTKNQPSSGATAVADPRGGLDPDKLHGKHRIERWDSPSRAVIAGRENGASAVADPRLEAEARRGNLGVKGWDQSSGVVSGEGFPSNGAYSVADPRPTEHPTYDSTAYGVRTWENHYGTCTAQAKPGGGPNSVADPRIKERSPFNNVFRIVEWGAPSPPITSARGCMAAVADPRPPARTDYKATKYRVTAMNEAAGTVISASTTGNGAFAVADPRSAALAEDREGYLTQGHYGVQHWDGTSTAIPAFAKNNNGRWSVADPRLPDAEAAELPALPGANDKLIAIIRALDGTWHRPITTLELAALQSIFDPEEHWAQDPVTQGEIDAMWHSRLAPFQLDGESDSGWRERIGNAVPPESAAAIASVFGKALLMSMTGEHFILSQEPIWVRPIAMALAIDSGQQLEPSA